jgi:iron-regulated transporter 1
MPELAYDQTGPDALTPLIAREAGETPGSPLRERGISASIAYRLYISHFLSTWNSRVFEFGAVLYLATIYPSSLLHMSVYALSRGLAAILFAPTVGHYIDIGNRLRVVQVSIGMFLYNGRCSKDPCIHSTSSRFSSSTLCCCCILRDILPFD